MSHTEKYIKFAELCSQTDYSDKKSVRAHNSAVDQMYKIVELAAKEGEDSISELYALLENEIASKWIAHHLVEKCELEKQVKKKCFSIVKKLSKGKGPDALGEKMWLKKWVNK